MTSDPSATQRKRPTSADVAREAGVSRATVSYVLNDAAGHRIPAATRDRVLAAAARLGYESNSVAKTLKRGHSDIVLLALPPWPLGSPITEMISAVCQGVAGLGYTPLVHVEQPDGPVDLVRVCQEIQPVGVIADGSHLDAGTLAAVRSAGTRAVIAYGSRKARNLPTIVISQHAIGACAAHYLADRGHKCVLGLMPAATDLQALGRARSAGAAAVFLRRGIAYRSEQAAFTPAAVAAALAGPMTADRPAAVFAFNDECAFQVIRCLGASGVAVPGDVAVIGCDDSPAAALYQPSLTSVRLGNPASWRTHIGVIPRILDGEDMSGWLATFDGYVVRRESA
jgi:DNA-binding LacI/PurR family transcriptional regulator